MTDSKVPQPGPARLTSNSGPDEWLQAALKNQHLPEAIMKRLCEICKEILMEGRFIPVVFFLYKLTICT
jgi:serine/threonine-protein phosphatase PP1-1